MLSRLPVENKLKSIGYRFHDELHHTRVWRRGEHYVNVPKKKIDESWVMATFRQCKLSDEEIIAFIRAAKG